MKVNVLEDNMAELVIEINEQDIYVLWSHTQPVAVVIDNDDNDRYDLPPDFFMTDIGDYYFDPMYGRIYEFFSKYAKLRGMGQSASESTNMEVKKVNIHSFLVGLFYGYIGYEYIEDQIAWAQEK